MITYWGDIHRSLGAFDDFRRRVDRLFEEFDGHTEQPTASWPRLNMFEEAGQITLVAEVPGLSDKDVTLSVNQDALTLQGERKVTAPEGYAVHRQERQGFRFTRSLSLPCKVDLERAAATVRDGVLTVTLPKTPESRPRQIAINS